MSRWLVLVHVATAFWLVAGLVGRDVTLAKARRSSDIKVVPELAELAGRFDRFAVVPGSIAVLAAGLIAALVQGQPFTGQGNWWLGLSVLIYLTLLPLVPWVFLPKGKVFEAALSDSIESAKITPELTAAFNDRSVLTARRYEWAVIAAIIVLMVAQPF
jgi:hypothetical protein